MKKTGKQRRCTLALASASWQLSIYGRLALGHCQSHTTKTPKRILSTQLFFFFFLFCLRVIFASGFFFCSLLPRFNQDQPPTWPRTAFYSTLAFDPLICSGVASSPTPAVSEYISRALTQRGPQPINPLSAFLPCLLTASPNRSVLAVCLIGCQPSLFRKQQTKATTRQCGEQPAFPLLARPSLRR